jgi:hypothetical protein
MSDCDKSKGELLSEIEVLRDHVEELERSQALGLEIEENLRQSQEDEHTFGEKLAQLVEINNALSLCKSIDDMCYQAVKQGCERLGFERLGIWFRSEKSDTVTGSFGVDMQGHMCDERGCQTLMQRDCPDGRVVLSREPVVLDQEAAVVDATGQVVGHAPQAFAGIWDGDEVIGHVSMDNHLTRQPISQRQCELLRLFGSAIGYLYTRKRIEGERERAIADLEEALGHIKTLSGLVPICCVCKKIRDDKGFWNQLEQYIQDHSDAEFSHGICPDCAKDLYPELYEKGLREKSKWNDLLEEEEGRQDVREDEKGKA